MPCSLRINMAFPMTAIKTTPLPPARPTRTVERCVKQRRSSNCIGRSCKNQSGSLQRNMSVKSNSRSAAKRKPPTARRKEKTVDRHASNIFNKLDVPSRAAATAYAYEHKLI